MVVENTVSTSVSSSDATCDVRALDHKYAVRQAHSRQIQREHPKVIPMCQEQGQGRRACCVCSEHIPRPLREAAASTPTC